MCADAHPVFARGGWGQMLRLLIVASQFVAEKPEPSYIQHTRPRRLLASKEAEKGPPLKVTVLEKEG